MSAEIQQQWRFLKSKLIYRLRVAFSTLPNIQAWLTTVVILLFFSAIALPLGFYTHFLKFEFLPNLSVNGFGGQCPPYRYYWVIVVAWLLFFGGYAQVTP